MVKTWKRYIGTNEGETTFLGYLGDGVFKFYDLSVDRGDLIKYEGTFELTSALEKDSKAKTEEELFAMAHAFLTEELLPSGEFDGECIA